MTERIGLSLVLLLIAMAQLATDVARLALEASSRPSINEPAPAPVVELASAEVKPGTPPAPNHAPAPAPAARACRRTPTWGPSRLDGPHV